MTIRVARRLIEQLLEEARRSAPEECCGLMFGSADEPVSIKPAANVHPDPCAHFEIDPQMLIDAHRAMRRGGPELVGYYHSHPAGEPRPSATDIDLAAADGMIWAIIGAGRVTFWRAGDAGFTPLPYDAVGS